MHSACGAVLLGRMQLGRPGHQARPPTAPRHRPSRLRQLEHPHGLGQARGLYLQALGRRGAFLDQRRVLLRHLIELRDGVAHLPDARGLLAGRAGELGDQLTVPYQPDPGSVSTSRSSNRTCRSPASGSRTRLTPSPTAGCCRIRSGVRAGDACKGARVDKSRPCVA